jgi:hypothetical protein
MRSNLSFFMTCLLTLAQNCAAPEGAFKLEELAASLKRCPDTKPLLNP